MYKYFIKRLLLLIPVAFGVSFLIFGILAITPGNPGSIILGAGATEEAVAELNHKLGEDLPFFTRYTRYVKNAIMKGDLGNSYLSRLPVFTEVVKRLPVSVLIAILGIMMSSVIGIPIGVLSAVKQYSHLFDTIPTIIALFFAAVPGFWLGMMLLLIFSLNLGWFPSIGIGSWRHFILPIISLALPYSARQLRFTRSSMLETIRQDYVLMARAKGASERIVIWKHAMKNALLPVITVIGSDFSGLIGGAVVVESLFSIPGLGTYIVSGVKMKDIPVVMASTILLSFVLAFIQLIVDFLYVLIDPRIKARYLRSE